jgi:hypothetical protein
MAEAANLEQTLLETLRSLSQAQQETVLNFARSLREHPTEQPLNLSLQQIAKLPIVERHKLLAAYIPATAQDFLTDPELTEFSILDTEDWEG